MRVQFVSPWYPNYTSPFSGVFIQKQMQALHQFGVECSVEVPQFFPAPRGPIHPTVTATMRELAAKEVTAIFEIVDEAVFVPTPVPARTAWTGRAHSIVSSISLKREFLPVSPDVTHAHLGVPTGWAMLQLGDRPLVVTEHNSKLGEILGDGPSAELYLETIRAADAFICVSEALRDQIADAFGEWVNSEIEIVPNVVDLADIPFTNREDNDFSAWIYVGALYAHKGVENLLRAFAEYRKEVDGSATLTIVGDGPLRSWVERYSTGQGIFRSVKITGEVPHAEIGRYLLEADLMVHLSPRETFGIASLEAIGAGLPVVSLRNGGADNAWGDMEKSCGTFLGTSAAPGDVVEAVAQLAKEADRLDPAAGRAMVEDRFSPVAVGQQLVKIYERCQQ